MVSCEAVYKGKGINFDLILLILCWGGAIYSSNMLLSYYFQIKNVNIIIFIKEGKSTVT